MKFSQLFSPTLLVTALLLIAVWSTLGQEQPLSGEAPQAGRATDQGPEEDLKQAEKSANPQFAKEESPETATESRPDSDNDLNKETPRDSEVAAVADDDAAINNEQTREILQNCIQLLKDRSIVSSLKQRGMLFGTELVASGTYLQADGGKGGVKAELEMQSQNLNLKLIMVNDGVYFFRQVRMSGSNAAASQLLDEQAKTIDAQSRPAVERINLRQIREQLKGNEAWPGHWIAYGGLYLFMDQARRSFNFTLVGERKLKGQQYQVLKGTWKPEMLAKLVPSQKESILNKGAIDWQRIPAQIPLEIEIYMIPSGKLTGFPFRIIFYRPNEELLEGIRNSAILISEYSDPRVIDTPPQSDFQFNAAENEVADVTEDFLGSLRR